MITHLSASTLRAGVPLSLDLTTYAALAATLLIALRRRTGSGLRRPLWRQLLTPSPVDLDHLDAIIDGVDDGAGSASWATDVAPRPRPAGRP